MDPAHQLEQFSLAYVRAVAAVAGVAVYQPSVDDDSVDLGLAARGSQGALRSPRLELQVKATGRDVLRHDGVHYPLRKKNFDDLRGSDFLVPRLLVVVVVPEKTVDWLDQSEEQLALRRCAYWLSLRDLPQRDIASTVTVFVPRSNLWTVEALSALMSRISRGEVP
ncbi:MAG: DUF4365 domain-containing protein [Thermoanaerobaculia bacterium]|nr:DUF4365 domain-containing protein [Thermoanaerobaculia bacterium]